MNPKLSITLASLLLSASLAALTGCSDSYEEAPQKLTRISAEIAAPAAETRSCIDGETLSLDFLGMVWEPKDIIGVFGTADSNVPFANEANSAQRKTTFSGHSAGMLQHAYFPWSESNDGVAVTALNGNLPAAQPVDSRHHVNADYKYGRVTGGMIDSEVQFTQLLSMARLEINANGTELADEILKSVTFTATRSEQPVMMSGDFNFSAVDGSLDFGRTDGESTAAVWENGKALTSKTTAFISLLPTLKKGDMLQIDILTDKQEVKFSVTVGVDFAPGNVYTFPLSLKVYQDNKEKYGWEAAPVDPSEEQDVEGFFTCAAMNVDGLPQKISFFSVNPDGPGEEGTRSLANAVLRTDWDFFAVSEDFEYNDVLYSILDRTYSHGEWRGSIGVAQLSSRADTDGLNFFWKNSVGTSEMKEWVQYTSEEGDLTKGANTCIKKGFRHYEVTVAPGVVVDVYITHMNTYSGNGNTESNKYVAAVLGQLRQLRDYVIAKMQETGRPAIVMGDTNMRYTRHDIKSNLIDAISGGISFNDPWVDFYRGGKFPEWDSKSLMIPSKFAGDTANDIVCSDDQRGEVVDKIWYFNYPGSDVTIEAVEYYNDLSDKFVKTTEAASYKGVQIEDEAGNVTIGDVSYQKKIGYADHFPVVCKFKYVYKKN